jgi:RND family efflux transporter MFP subunit
MSEMELQVPEGKKVGLAGSTEEQLQAEIEQLKRQLEEQHRGHQAAASKPTGPSAKTLFAIAIVLVALITGAFFAGYMPRQRRETVLANEAVVESQALPTVTVVSIGRAQGNSELALPGNIQAITEAPILARASGYVKERLVDIGDRVAEGQILAVLEAPELQHQIDQANSAVTQASDGLQQAEANLTQARANEELARVTAERWKNLVQRGAVSRQENDTYQAQYAAQQANVESLEKAAAAAQSSIAGAQFNLARLKELQGYLQVRAPFAGVITLRNIDVGALVTEANTLLYRIAQTGRLRTYVSVPQADAASVRVGQRALLTIPNLPGRKFAGTVTRTANALDPTTRTLLTEVQAPNPDGALLPGMYTDVDLSTPRSNPPLMIPADTLVVRSNGPQVAVVGTDGLVHFTPIQLGRDYGDQLEVLAGLELGQQVVINPSDAVREGAKVNAVPLRPDAPAKTGSPTAPKGRAS